MAKDELNSAPCLASEWMYGAFGDLMISPTDLFSSITMTTWSGRGRPFWARAVQTEVKARRRNILPQKVSVAVGIIIRRPYDGVIEGAMTQRCPSCGKVKRG